MICTSKISLICSILLCTALVFISGSTVAQSSCSEYGKVQVYSGDNCGYLYEKVSTNTGQTRDGIEITGTESSSLVFGLDTTLIDERTWGGGSSYTWTFNEGSTPAPAFAFTEGGINMTGHFKQMAIGSNSTIGPTIVPSLFIEGITGTNCGIYQNEPGDDNYFAGRSLIGSVDIDATINNKSNIIAWNDGTNGLTHNMELKLDQAVTVDPDSHPSSIVANFDYSAVDIIGVEDGLTFNASTIM